MFFKRRSNNRNVVYAPLDGEVVNLTMVSDPTFAQKMLGDGVAIMPLSGEVYAPFDGAVEMVFRTKHAISLTSDSGIELLIHVGLDTVKLAGKYFDVKVTDGMPVKKGDLLLTFDIEGITNEGFDIVTPVIVCNVDSYKSIQGLLEGKRVSNDDIVIQIN